MKDFIKFGELGDVELKEFARQYRAGNLEEIFGQFRILSDGRLVFYTQNPDSNCADATFTFGDKTYCVFFDNLEELAIFADKVRNYNE